MENEKMLNVEELEKISGGTQVIWDYYQPEECPVCGKPLTRHPDIMDRNGFPLFVCSSNVYDENHWVLWGRKNMEI